MRALPTCLSLFALCAAMAGCTSQPAVAPTQQNGWLVYSGDHVAVNAVCGTEPIRLTGDHTEATLTGECGQVELTGSHNDVDVAMAPGGTFTILGDNNDVWWHPSGPGVAPTMTIRGNADAFHASKP